LQDIFTKQLKIPLPQAFPQCKCSGRTAPLFDTASLGDIPRRSSRSWALDRLSG